MPNGNNGQIGNTPPVYNPPPIRGPVPDPALITVIQAVVGQIFNQLNCHQVGAITAFYPATQTADIQPGMQYLSPQNTETPSWVGMTPAILRGVPCIFVGGGSCSLTFPIVPGDTCLLLFVDRDIGNWFTSGVTTTPPPSRRAHSTSDAVAIVGLRNMTNLIPIISTTDAQLHNHGAGSVIGVGSLIRVATSGSSLFTLIQTIITALSQLNAATPGNPASLSILAATSELNSLLKV